MKKIAIGEFQELLPDLFRKVGEDYVIVDEKKLLIVGRVKVLEAPVKLDEVLTYTKKRGDDHE